MMRALVAILALMAAGGLQAAEPLFETICVFSVTPKSKPNFRIPAILQAPNGDLLIFAEKRNDGPGDVGNTDIVLKRSRDKGKTWIAEQVIFDDGDRTCTDITVGIEHSNGKLWLFFLRDKKQFAYFTSTDSGATWQGPVVIHEQVAKPEWDKLNNGKGDDGSDPASGGRGAVWAKGWQQRYGVGPGNAMVQLKSGRLVVPARHREDIGGGRLRSFSHTFYSDDHGATWKLGGTVGVNTSECQLVEMANGDVMLISRDESSEDSPANLRHRVAVSRDGGETWEPIRRAEELITPRCHGAVERFDKNRLLFSSPASNLRQPQHPYGRTNLTVRVSSDEGATWSVGKTIWPHPSSYSDIAALDDGTIGLVYERGPAGSTHYWDELHFARFNLEWLTNGNDLPSVLAERISTGGIEISPASPLRNLVLRKELGLVTAPCVDGQIVHRARKPGDMVLETRTTITPGGDYLLMFPEGGHYGSSKGQKVNDLIAYRSSDKGKTWVGPKVAFDIDYNQHGFVPLIPRGSKRIYAFGTQPIPGKWTTEHGQAENAPIGFRWSDDDGHSWSAVKLIEPINDPGFKGMSVMRMCETDVGTWLIGSHEGDWSKKPLQTRQYILRSEDRGNTWTVLPQPRPNGWFAKDFGRMDEGRVINLGGGHVFGMFRTPQGHLWSARSDDDGKTWADPAPTPLVHPDAPPMLFHLADGKTLIAFHHNRHAKSQYVGLTANMEGQKDRSELWVSTSADEGRTWSEPRFVLANALAPTFGNAWKDHQCSYADLIVDGDDLHLFLPHRWQRALHLRLKASDLATLPTKAELAAAAKPAR